MTCSFVVYEAWIVGGNANLTINNPNATPLSTWRVEITRAGKKISLWNANTSTTTTKVTAWNLSWNGKVPGSTSQVVTGGGVTGLVGVNQSFTCKVVKVT